jgi:hypothetical protein
MLLRVRQEEWGRLAGIVLSADMLVMVHYLQQNDRTSHASQCRKTSNGATRRVLCFMAEAVAKLATKLGCAGWPVSKLQRALLVCIATAST